MQTQAVSTWRELTVNTQNSTLQIEERDGVFKVKGTTNQQHQHVVGKALLRAPVVDEFMFIPLEGTKYCVTSKVKSIMYGWVQWT